MCIVCVCLVLPGSVACIQSVIGLVPASALHFSESNKHHIDVQLVATLKVFWSGCCSHVQHAHPAYQVSLAVALCCEIPHFCLEHGFMAIWQGSLVCLNAW